MGQASKGNSDKHDSKGGASDEDHSTSHESADSEDHSHEDIGSKGSGNKGGKNKDGSEGVVDSGGGSIVELKVTVTGLDDGTEVNVTLDREGEEQTVKTDNHVAVFNVKFSGGCTLTGEPVSGYITPHKEVKIIGSDRHPEEELHYEEAGEIPVTAVNIVEEDLEIVIGETVNLNAVVKPTNAIDKSVTWKSSDEVVASVDPVTGLVTTLGVGSTIITVTTNDGEYTDTCVITVIEPPVIDVYVTHISLNKDTIDLVKGDNEELIATIKPPSATLKDVIWTSGNDDVASVKTKSVTDDGIVTADVTAKSAGTTVITATAKDGSGCEAYCFVTVTLPPEEELIYASNQAGDITEHFDSAEDVYINVVDPDFNPEEYHVKLEQRGSDGLLGKGRITFSAEDIMKIEDGKTWVRFNLIKAIPDIAGIEDTDILNNSKECFFYMSLDKDYPKDDEKTLKTNFKIGSAIPTGDIKVTTEFNGGDRTDLSGVKFILGRALYEDDPDNPPYSEKYEHYEVESESAVNGYSDEVKAWGITDANGEIHGFRQWDESITEDKMEEGVWYTKEILKLGGYILLQEPIKGYINNLENSNPDSDDGEPLKVVHIKRNGYEERHVTNIFIGNDTPGITINPDKLDLLVGEEEQLVATINPHPLVNLDVIWSSDNPAVAAVDESSGVVTAVSKGTAIITVGTADGRIAYCVVSVSPVPEEEYIFASDENGVINEHFDSASEVYINLVNYELGTTYYAKLEQKGNDPDLGKNLVGFRFDIDIEDGIHYVIDEHTSALRFKLTDVIEDIKPVTKFSKECFFYISKDSSFPQDEEITFKTNFKIGSAVPTGNIEVSTKFIGGLLESEDVSKAGIRFILARALYEDDPDHEAYSETYEDYILHREQGEPVYSDEVKMWGLTNEAGEVEWLPPREILKIGGYILLQQPIQGYTNNLDLPNPESDDGEPLKAVHITRDGLVKRKIINIYTGPGEPSNNNSYNDMKTSFKIMNQMIVK